MTNPSTFTIPARVVACACLTLLMLTFSVSSHAALTLNNTRLVFNGDKRSTSVVVRNPSKSIYAVQAWINTDADDNTTSVPFATSPPLFKINPNSEQLLKIIGLPNTLPHDRESLFFFNVQEIPQVSSDTGNQLNIALRTRIKLFYRPHTLKGTPTDHLNSLTFSLSVRNGVEQLVVKNPSPFHITFNRLEVNGQGQQTTLKNTAMLEPFGEKAYPLTGITRASSLQARFSIVNDYGGFTEPLSAPIQLAN
ncbi:MULTISPECIES: molecular chaperone [Pseudomonas]|nr:MULTISPECIES: molecular chaperone [Pseudomonas]UZM91847.1 molecular chaperone [Pseudomonas putida DOT-T1E]WPO28641.1 molecular chaperone [Pseudomonas sp. BO3-4]